MSDRLRSAALRASLVLILAPPGLIAQAPIAAGSGALTLTEALARAARVSPALSAAREEAAATAARERQAAAFANPSISFQREQTSATGQRNSQNILTLDQPLEPGLRDARRDAAAHRREAADARRRDVGAQLALDVTRAFAHVIAADRRAELASRAAEAFDRARRVSDERLAAGDISGYANRRLRLEAARYGALRAEASLARRSSRLALLALIASRGAQGDVEALRIDTSYAAFAPIGAADSLVVLALERRGDLAAARLDARAALADAALASRERIPTPVLTAGIKTERIEGVGDLSGIAAGVILPLPLWDRRRGSVDAAEATSRRRDAEAELLGRRVEFEVRDAAAAAQAVDEQVAALAPSLGDEATQALRSAETAYAEGEIALIEWLDAVRAYQEAEAAFAALRAESLIRRAALDRAVGLPLRSSSK